MLPRSLVDTLVAIDRDGVLPGMRSQGYTGMLSPRMLREREERREAWYAMREGRAKSKRDLSGRANGTIDPWYACFLGAEVQDYALNFSVPWSGFLHRSCHR